MKEFTSKQQKRVLWKRLLKQEFFNLVSQSGPAKIWEAFCDSRYGLDVLQQRRRKNWRLHWFSEKGIPFEILGLYRGFRQSEWVNWSKCHSRDARRDRRNHLKAKHRTTPYLQHTRAETREAGSLRSVISLLSAKNLWALGMMPIKSAGFH